MKVAWKVINGYGPYAYLQEAVWQGNNKVVSKHIKYLGSFGKGGVLPGNKVKGYPKVRISVVPRELVVQLKPKPAEKVRDYHNKLKKKMGSYEISDDDMNQWLETLEETLSPEEVDEFQSYDPSLDYLPLPADIPDLRRDLSEALEQQAIELDQARADVKNLESLYSTASIPKDAKYLAGLTIPQLYLLIAYGKGSSEVDRRASQRNVVADYWHWDKDDFENIEAPELLGELLDLGPYNSATQSYKRKRNLRDVQMLFGNPMTLADAKAKQAVIRANYNKTKKELQDLAA